MQYHALVESAHALAQCCMEMARSSNKRSQSQMWDSPCNRRGMLTSTNRLNAPSLLWMWLGIKRTWGGAEAVPIGYKGWLVKATTWLMHFRDFPKELGDWWWQCCLWARAFAAGPQRRRTLTHSVGTFFEGLTTAILEDSKSKMKITEQNRQFLSDVLSEDEEDKWRASAASAQVFDRWRNKASSISYHQTRQTLTRLPQCKGAKVSHHHDMWITN